MEPITITRTTQPRPRVPDAQLGFGNVFTDHIFRAEFTSEKGWHSPRVEPYGPLTLDPAALCLHYGQLLFEGLKAFRHRTGGLRLFRAESHARRMARSAERLCMPPVPESLFLDGARAVLREDLDWAPTEAGTALYLRPTLIATEPAMSVRPSTRYSFFILVSPVGSYYGGGALAPVRIWVERELTRAAPGGIGEAKTGGNYAASLLASARAKEHGYAQVLWTDAASHRQLEEVGTMNLFLRVDDEVFTPPLSGTILPGITRDSVLTLLRSWGVKVSEQAVTTDDLLRWSKENRLREVFGTGTAAVISPVAELGNLGTEPVRINDGKVGELSQRLYDAITAIQYGRAADTRDWLSEV